MNGYTHIFDTVDMLYTALEEQWQLIAREAIADHGAFHVALAGGNTPRHFYARLAQLSAIDKTCWHQTYLYFGDERCVPQDHPESNYRMVKESLLSGAPLLPEHVHAMFSSELSVDENVSRYETVLVESLPVNSKGIPVFDLVLLGMGDDGHTASLFPDTDIVNEIEKLVAAQLVKKLEAWRISLTFPTINAANHVAVLVVGDTKATVLADISSDDEASVSRYPIQKVFPAGRLDWYLDTAAAHLLKT